MKVRKVHYIPTAWLSAQYGYTTACTRNPDGVETTNDVTQTTCGSCMKRPEYRRDMATATRAVTETPVCTLSNECAVCLGGGICPDRCATCGGTNSRECRTHDSILLVDVEADPTPVSTPDARTAQIMDLRDRAEFLGYDDQAAARVADCFDVAHTYDPCTMHPGHSTTMDMWGYAADECEACKVLRMSTETGYTVTAVAERRESARQTMPGYLETGDRHGTPVTGDQGPDLPDLPQAPCTRARLEHTATMDSDATYAAAHDATLIAMCRAYIRTRKAIHRTTQATGYTVALIDYVRITFPDLTQDQAELVVCEALADACADLAD